MLRQLNFPFPLQFPLSLSLLFLSLTGVCHPPNTIARYILNYGIAQLAVREVISFFEIHVHKIRTRVLFQAGYTWL